MNKNTLTLDELMERTGLATRWKAIGRKEEHDIWQNVVTDKDARPIDIDAELARLREQLKKKK